MNVSKRIVTVELWGEVDADAVASAQFMVSQVLDDAGVAGVVLDLSRADHVDFSAAESLGVTRRMLLNGGREFAVHASLVKVRQAIRAGCPDLVVCATRDQAEAYVRGEARPQKEPRQQTRASSLPKSG